MIETGDRVLLSGAGREFFVKAGPGSLGTDKGQLDLAQIVGKSPGDIITTHSGAEFTIRIPRPTDFFTYGKRSGAPMLPKDIGLVIAYTGMNHNDDVLDAGTGSGIAAIYFGGVAKSVKTYEVRPEFSTLAKKNITDAKLANVEAIAADFLAAEGTFDVVHLDMQIQPEHVAHAYSLLRPGGYLACYTPFLEQMAIVVDAASEKFAEVHTHELIEREMTRS
ncbi:methyltransferase domain-containing protein, partial [Methanoregula sp.]|uniref:methyltransferase domain-containing protein n=1 Tax=Methanoregula sp. TaxID=2052170 RepID=UPI00261FF5B1